MMKRQRFFLLTTGLLAAFVGWGMKVEKVPNPRAAKGLWVEDGAKVLSPDQIQSVNSVASELEAKTSVELAVVTVDSLEGLTVEDYAEKLFKRFGVGKKGKDNGILLLISPKDRKVRIEVGYGLEGVLTDAVSKRIIEQLGIPRFKEQNYFQGLFEMSREIARAVAKSQGVSLSEAEAPSEEPALPEALPPSPPEENPPSVSGPGFEDLFSRSIEFGFPGFAFLAFFWSLFRYGRARALAARRVALQGLNKVSGVVGVGGGLTAIFLSGLFPSISSIFFFLGVSVLGPLLLIYFLKRLLNARLLHYQINCSKCGARMTLIDETKDDEFLSTEERAEEKAKGMDYEFWRCPQCSSLERLEVKLSGASNCAKCGRRSLVSTSAVVTAATTMSSGLRRHEEKCFNSKCNFFKTWTTTIPRVSSSSSSSSSGSSSSFGGGRSGGGGSSGSW